MVMTITPALSMTRRKSDDGNKSQLEDGVDDDDVEGGADDLVLCHSDLQYTMTFGPVSPSDLQNTMMIWSWFTLTSSIR